MSDNPTYGELEQKIRELERELIKHRQSSVLFECIFKPIPEATIYTDTKRRIVMSNPALTRILGYSEEEIAGKHTAILYTSKESYEEQGKIRFNLSAEEKLKPQGAFLNSCFLCPHATPEYASQKPGTNFHPHLVHDCQCLKPALGMVFNALKAEGITPDSADFYIIGDRSSDVQTALNINGTGILIPFVNEPGEIDKVRLLEKQGQIYVAETMLDATEYIVSRAGKEPAPHV